MTDDLVKRVARTLSIGVSHNEILQIFQKEYRISHNEALDLLRRGAIQLALEEGEARDADVASQRRKTW